MNKYVLRATLLSALALSMTPSAYAAEYQLDDFIVTGTRVKADVKDVAANVTVINNEAIEKGNYSNVSQALKSANVDVVDKNGVSYAVLNGDSRVLVLVNGRKQNFDHLTVSGATNATDLGNISMDNVDHIEIVRGPNSSLYGEKASAGVINIITKAPGPESRTSVTAEYGSWNHRRAAITNSGGDENNRYMITYSKEKRGNYHYKDVNGTSHVFPDSKINQEEATLRYDHYFGNDRATFDFARNRSKNGGGLSLRNPLAGIIMYPGRIDDSTVTDMGLTYTFNQKNKGDGTFVRLGRVQDKTSAPFSSSYRHNLKGLSFEGQKNWTLKNHNLVGGVSWEEQKLWEENGGAIMDAKATTKALFAEDNWTLGDGWSMNLGGRYEHHSDFGGNWTSHVGLNKRISNDTRAYVSWGQAVNNPTLKMRYAATPFWVGNPNLEQETSQTVTLGVDSKINDRLNLSASAYQSRLKNALKWQSNPVAGLPGMYVNADREKRNGISLNANYKINEAWRLRAGYEFAKVQTKNAASSYLTDTTNTRPNGYSLGIDYSKNKWDASLNLRYVTGRSQQQFTDSRYVTLDMNLNYQWTPSTKVYLKGYNLTNEHYESFASTTLGAYAMPERHFVAGVTHNF